MGCRHPPGQPVGGFGGVLFLSHPARPGRRHPAEHLPGLRPARRHPAPAPTGGAAHSGAGSFTHTSASRTRLRRRCRRRHPPAGRTTGGGVRPGTLLGRGSAGTAGSSGRTAHPGRAGGRVRPDRSPAPGGHEESHGQPSSHAREEERAAETGGGDDLGQVHPHQTHPHERGASGLASGHRHRQGVRHRPSGAEKAQRVGHPFLCDGQHQLGHRLQIHGKPGGETHPGGHQEGDVRDGGGQAGAVQRRPRIVPLRHCRGGSTTCPKGPCGRKAGGAASTYQIFQDGRPHRGEGRGQARHLLGAQGHRHHRPRHRPGIP